MFLVLSYNLWYQQFGFTRCAYILNQDSLPPSYKSFLNKHGGKDPVILQGVRDIACGMPFTNLEQIQKFYKNAGVDVVLDSQMKVPCSVFSPPSLLFLFIWRWHCWPIYFLMSRFGLCFIFSGSIGYDKVYI